MKDFFARLRLLFQYGPELDRLVRKEREIVEEQKRKQRATMLQLCVAHQQEPNRSHFSPHNCDYCKLLTEQKVRTSLKLP